MNHLTAADITTLTPEVAAACNYEDFLETEQLEYYGPEECARIRRKIEENIIQLAQQLLEKGSPDA